MSLKDITRTAVLQAIAEAEALGPERFLAEHGFEPARTYKLAYGGRLYDSKAIVGVAHGYATGEFWRAPDFSGGLRTVVPTLTSLGFVVDIVTDDPERDSIGYLASLDALHTASFEGQSADYQYVVLLWAISNARAGKPRKVHYSAARKELAGLLSLFQLASSPPSVANPWHALRNSPWWELDMPAGFPIVRYKDIPLRDPAAGLRAGIYGEVKDDANFAGQAIDRIFRLMEQPGPTHILLNRLGLLDLATARSNGVVVTNVPIDGGPTHQRKVSPPNSGEEIEARLVEADLLARYCAFLESQRHTVSRHEILLPGEHRALLTDLFDEETRELVDVHSRSDRHTVRLALGQILDSSRHVSHRTRAVLVPEQPTPDLINLLHTNGVGVVWPTDDDQFVAVGAP